jgi:hypothetical protein
MKNADKPANPCITEFEGMQGETYKTTYHGLTKREIFAMAAMQGMLSGGVTIDVDKDYPFQTRAQTCLLIADALLAELEKTK